MDNNPKSIGYQMRMSLVNEFPELRGENGSIGLFFGLTISEAFDEFKAVDHIAATDLLRAIDSKRRLVNLLGKNHPDYLKHALEHDLMVDISNKMQDPINKLLGLYKKAQKQKGRIISVRKPRGK